jgi:hypothetical protein
LIGRISTEIFIVLLQLAEYRRWYNRLSNAGAVSGIVRHSPKANPPKGGDAKPPAYSAQAPR